MRAQAILCLLAGVVCAGFAATANAADTVTVFAAASLTDVLTEIGKAYQAKTGTEVKFSFASSSALAKQIESGAPASVFVSADGEWMDYLQSRGLTDSDTRKDLLGNHLVLVAGKDNAIALKIAPGFALAEALGDGRLSVADPDSVPAGKYTKQALTALGVWAAVEPKLARAENVRAALAFVTKGEAPLGIVYTTDALAEKGVRVVDTFPDDTHKPIVYPIALVKGQDTAAAKALLQALKGGDFRSTYEKYGFVILK